MTGRQKKQRRLYANAHLVSPNAQLNETGGLLVEDGLIVASGPKVDASTVSSDTQVIDCSGLCIFPGLVDMNVSTGEPGGEHRETLATASEAAAAGGITTIAVLPDTDPVVDNPALVDFVIRRGRDTSKVNVAPYAAMTKALKGEQMTEIGLLRQAGAVAITDAHKFVSNAGLFRRILSYARDHDMLAIQHVEEPSLSGGAMNAGELASRLGLAGMHKVAEITALERDCRLVEATGARYHAAMISCAESVDIVRTAKAKGLPITCGVAAHHLILNENDIGTYRTFFKVSPPLRDETDRRSLIAGVEDGTIDVVCSAHRPQTADTKRLPFSEAAFGAVGLETALSVCLTLVQNENLSLVRVVQAMSEVPSKLLGLEKGSLKSGQVADFVVVDPNKSWLVADTSLRSKAKNSPFEHSTLEGRAVETVVAGQTVFTYSD
jgi:dihydroorotase